RLPARRPLASGARDAPVRDRAPRLDPRLGRRDRAARGRPRTRLRLRPVHLRARRRGGLRDLPRTLPPVRGLPRAARDPGHRRDLRRDDGGGRPSRPLPGALADAHHPRRGPRHPDARAGGAGVRRGRLRTRPDPRRDPRRRAHPRRRPRPGPRRTLPAGLALWADEILIVTVTWSWEARVRSYELVAEATGLSAGPSALGPSPQ